MSDNREIARDLLEKLLIPAEAETMSYDEAIAEIMAFADAATERGRRQGWSADEATVERVRVAIRDEYGSRLCTWRGERRFCPRESAASSVCACEAIARAAIAAIPAPPAPEGA